jgi:hypothetical protein
MHESRVRLPVPVGIRAVPGQSPEQAGSQTEPRNQKKKQGDITSISRPLGLKGGDHEKTSARASCTDK